MPPIHRGTDRLLHYALLRLSVKHPVRSILSVLAIYGALGIMFYGLYKVPALEREHELLSSAPYREQVERLAELENSLRGFHAYVMDQKRSIQATEETMQKLKAEQQALEPVVAANRTAVAAVLEAQERRFRASRWFDHALAFVFGVISSLVATYIWWLVGRGTNQAQQGAQADSPASGGPTT